MIQEVDKNNYEIEVNREKAIIKGIQKLTNNDRVIAVLVWLLNSFFILYISSSFFFILWISFGFCKEWYTCNSIRPPRSRWKR